MKFSKKQKQLLYYEFAKFVGSGFGFEKACETIIVQPGAESIQVEFCQGVLISLKKGQTVAQAVASLPLNISTIEVKMIEAGEQAGLLERSFENLSQHFKLAIETGAKIKKGVAYPLIMLNVAILLALLSISMMATWSPDAKEGSGWESFRVGLVIVVVLYLLTIGIITFFIQQLKRAGVSVISDRWMSYIPLLGKMRNSLAMGRFCEVFHMSLNSGQKMDRSLSMAGASSGSACIFQASEFGSKKLNLGESLSATLADQTAVFPADFCRSINNAELAGVLDEDFARWADYYTKSANDDADRLAQWAPRLFYWLVLIIVGLLVIRIGLSYRTLLESYLHWNEQY